HDWRQLERNPEPDRLRLQHHAGAGRRRDAEPAPERRTQGSADGGDLILGLERAHAERLVAGKLLEYPRGRRDWIRAEEEGQPAQLRRRDQPVRKRLVAGDLPVAPRLEPRRLDRVLNSERLRGLAKRISRLERLLVAGDDLGP